MDRLWGLKFTTMFAGNVMWAYFDNEEAARVVFEKYVELIAQKPQEAMLQLVFEDLFGKQAMRVEFFPQCGMIEFGSCDLVWKEINKKIKDFQDAANQEVKVGFKTDN